MEEIRLGTIGSGVIVHSILDVVEQTEGIRCAAVYSRTEEKGRALADTYGVKKVYTDMDEFLQDEETNFIYIATPNLLHYEQVKRALIAGKNVICEKPFCTKASQAREPIELAEEKGLILVDAVPPAFLPNMEILTRREQFIPHFYKWWDELRLTRRFLDFRILLYYNVFANQSYLTERI